MRTVYSPANQQDVTVPWSARKQVRSAPPSTAVYRRRRPERTPLYRVVQGHFETYLALARDGHFDADAVPAYVEREFRRYLDCGILAHGFARAFCEAYQHDFLIAFSCKGRGACPACNARRMVETAAHVADHVMPRLPVQHWVPLEFLAFRGRRAAEWQNCRGHWLQYCPRCWRHRHGHWLLAREIRDMITVLDYHDPAAPDHTAAFVAALNTGRSVYVPRGDYHVASASMPVFQPGQRLLGEGKWSTRIYCHGRGDAFVLCHQLNANGGNGAGIESVSLVGVDDQPDTMGIRITGGADFVIRDVCVTGFAHLVVLDGCNLARVDGLWLGGAVSGGHIYPQHGLWLTDGAEAGRGWTLAGGTTNGTLVTNLTINEGGPCPVQLRRVGTRVIGFHSNSGNWLVGGVNITVAHGSFETPDPTLIVCDGGTHVRFVDIYAGASTLLRVDELVHCLEVVGCRGQGPHLVECANHAKLIAPAILASSQWNGGDRAISPEQVYGENGLCQVYEPYRSYSDGRGSLGIGCVQPTGRLDVQYGDVAGQTGARVREGGVTKWVVP